MGQARRHRRIDQSRVASRTSQVGPLGGQRRQLALHIRPRGEQRVDRSQRPDPRLFTFQVYNPKLDATIVITMNSDKKVNGEQGINVLLRDISKILLPNNPVNVPVIK